MQFPLAEVDGSCAGKGVRRNWGELAEEK